MMKETGLFSYQQCNYYTYIMTGILNTTQNSANITISKTRTRGLPFPTHFATMLVTFFTGFVLPLVCQ